LIPFKIYVAAFVARVSGINRNVSLGYLNGEVYNSPKRKATFLTFSYSFAALRLGPWHQRNESLAQSFVQAC
jgi:hypothetical protein